MDRVANSNIMSVSLKQVLAKLCVIIGDTYPYSS